MEPVIIFFHRGDYDAVHEGLSIAAAATALGRSAELYFSWFALERLVRDRLDEPDLRSDIADAMERRQAPTLRKLYEQVRGTGQARLFACSGSLMAMGFTPDQVEAKVDELVGWAGILKRTAGKTDRFFL